MVSPPTPVVSGTLTQFRVLIPHERMCIEGDILDGDEQRSKVSDIL
jgi:hypothetical protein